MLTQDKIILLKIFFHIVQDTEWRTFNIVCSDIIGSWMILEIVWSNIICPQSTYCLILRYASMIHMCCSAETGMWKFVVYCNVSRNVVLELCMMCNFSLG